MNYSNHHLSDQLRILLIVAALVLLQLNVPVATPFDGCFSADFTLHRPEPPVRSWQNLRILMAGAKSQLSELKRDFIASANLDIEKHRSFKIVKVESKKSAATSAMTWPVTGKISSGFGMRRHPVTYVRSFHNGIDIKARRGTRIIAPADGQVLSAGRAGLLGRMVKIKTSNGSFLYFGHLQKISCRKGQKIKRGQVIGTVGSSGRATGPHLHFSVKVNSKYSNPLNYLPKHK